MTQKLFTNRDGTLRLYEAGTPYYLELKFDAGDLSGPIGRPLVEEMLKLDKGRASTDAHYITGPDDKIFEPQAFSFSAFMVGDLTTSQYFRQWIAALNDGGSTTVNSQTLTTTKGTTVVGGITAPAFADSNKLACNLEVLLDGDSADWGMQYNEVWFPQDQCKITISENDVVLAVSGLIYGSIDPEITAFTAGTDITS